MKTLTQHYDILQKVYSRIESLTSTALFKAMRSAESFVGNRKALPKVQDTNDYLILPQEDEHDQIAYSDAINRKFGLYYNLAFGYLKLYLKENYGTNVIAHKKIIDACLGYKLINNIQARDLLKIIAYAKSIQIPYNENGDFQFSDEIVVYTTLLNEIITKFKPVINLNKKLVTHYTKNSGKIEPIYTNAKLATPLT